MRGIALDGDAVGSVVADAGLSVAGRLSGGAQLRVTASGAAVRIRQLLGYATAEVTAAGDFYRYQMLAGDVQIRAEAAGLLARERFLAGDAVIVVEAAGLLDGDYSQPPSICTVSAQGSLRVSRRMTGTAPAVASATGELMRVRPLWGQATVAPQATGGLSVWSLLSGVAAGVVTVEASAFVFLLSPLAAAVAVDAAGTMEAIRQLSGHAAMAGTANGAFLQIGETGFAPAERTVAFAAAERRFDFVPADRAVVAAFAGRTITVQEYPNAVVS